MKTIDAYQKALQILMEDNKDWRAICYSIAIANPDLFVKICSPNNAITDKRIQIIQSNAIDIAKDTGKISAIKYLRSELGITLKEAKDRIESLTTVFKGSYK